MPELNGFWSYVHADDDTEGGRITRLGRDVVSQFELLTGERINLFLDADALQWGDSWRSEIDGSLSSIAFFVPVLTPRYFLSAECRRELQFVLRRAANLGVKQLVLPLLYVMVPGLDGGGSEDDLVKLVATFQWEDWRELRFAEPTSEPYRRAVARLAERLLVANREAERAPQLHAASVGTSMQSEQEDAPGFLDRVAKLEEALPQWNETIVQIGQEIGLVGDLLQSAARDIKISDANGKGFGGRQFIARRAAREVTEPTERIVGLANDFATQMHDVDAGFRALIEQVDLEPIDDADVLEAVCFFFGAIRTLASSARESFASTQQLIDGAGPVEKLSRDLRPPLRRLREGLTQFVEAREVIEEWLRMIESTTVECPQVDLE